MPTKTQALVFSPPFCYSQGMKKDIHPTYYPKATVKCACGNTFTVGSTKESLEIEVCSACHPFYTGKDKMLDKMGQVQKFRKRAAQKKASSPKKARKSKGGG